MKRYRVSSVIRSAFVLTVLLVGSLPTAAFAYDEDFYQSNDILYYSGSSGACVSPGAGYTTTLDLPTLVGNENAEKIWNFLTDPLRGLSKEQAAGVMGNIAQESAFNPAAEEGEASFSRHTVRPVGFGIVQWTGPRRLALEEAAKEQGVAVSDLGFQLAYMVQESKDRQVSADVAALGYGTEGENEWETLKKQATIEDATVFWHNNFEVSADTPEEVIKTRGDYAQNAYISFKDMDTSGLTRTTSTTSSNGCIPFAGGDLRQTLLAYAHPEFHENNWSGPVPPPKKEYLDIATKLSNEGKWVGGGLAEIGIPGIDCGGFVSILLTQSGFEPDYNFGLEHERGASNQEYGQLPWAKKYWTYLGNGGSINVSDLRPGDVAYSSGHTFVFVGQIDGFSSQYASASYDWWRAPMAAGSWDGGFESATNPDYVWYGRREGSPEPYGSTNINDSGGRDIPSDV